MRGHDKGVELAEFRDRVLPRTAARKDIATFSNSLRLYLLVALNLIQTESVNERVSLQQKGPPIFLSRSAILVLLAGYSV